VRNEQKTVNGDAMDSNWKSERVGKLRVLTVAQRTQRKPFEIFRYSAKESNFFACWHAKIFRNLHFQEQRRLSAAREHLQEAVRSSMIGHTAVQSLGDAVVSLDLLLSLLPNGEQQSKVVVVLVEQREGRNHTATQPLSH